MKEANVVFFTRKTIQKKEEAFGHEVLCNASLLQREVTGSNFTDEEMKQTAYDMLLTLESKLVMLASLICKQDFRNQWTKLEVEHGKSVNKKIVEKLILEVVLAKVTDDLNSQIQHTGWSARGVYCGQYQLTGAKLEIDDLKTQAWGQIHPLYPPEDIPLNTWTHKPQITMGS